MFNFLWSFVVGPVAGWLTGRLMRSKGIGWLDIIAGLVGALIVTTIFALLGSDFSSTEIGTALISAVGAVVVTFLFRKVAAKNPDALPKGASTRSFTSYKSRMGK